MAVSQTPKDSEKRRRSKKRKSRTAVEVSSSESDSDAKKKKRKSIGPTEADHAPSQPTRNIETVKDNDVSINDPPVPAALSTSGAESKSTRKEPEGFGSIYLRKITAELADDLDKVRGAPDFRTSSLPMLIHALKQGESIYSTEEKRRVVGAANS